MKKVPVVTGVSISIFLATLILASPQKYRWGGPGYDPYLKPPHTKDKKISSRYYAYVLGAINTGGQEVKIGVDSEETVARIKRMDIISSNGTRISSEKCGKAMHHEEAPWSCSFALSDMDKLNGRGNIQIFDQSRIMLIEGSIDFDALKNALGVK